MRITVYFQRLDIQVQATTNFTKTWLNTSVLTRQIYIPLPGNQRQTSVILEDVQDPQVTVEDTP